MKKLPAQIIIIILYLFPFSFISADTSIAAKAAIEKKVVCVGEDFLFQIQVTGVENVAEPDLAFLKDFNVEFLCNDNYENSFTSIIRGKMTREIKYENIILYNLSAKVTGDLTIPPIKIRIDGKSYQTQAIPIEVKKADSENIREIYNKSIDLFFKDEIGASKKLLQDELLLNPGDKKLLRILNSIKVFETAQKLAFQKEFIIAKKLINKELKEDMNNSILLGALENVQLLEFVELEQYPEARAILEKRIKETPGNFMLFQQYASCLRMMEEYSEAIKFYNLFLNKIEELHTIPESTELLYHSSIIGIAKCFFAIDNYDDVILYLKKLEVMKSKYLHDEVYWYIGVSYIFKRDYANAQSYFLKAYNYSNVWKNSNTVMNLWYLAYSCYLNEDMVNYHQYSNILMQQDNDEYKKLLNAIDAL